MEVIKEALIVENNGLRTSCFILENIPMDLLYHKVRKTMPLEEYSERLVPAFTIDEKGTKIPTGEMIWEVLPGIKVDKHSGAFVFTMESDDSKSNLEKLDLHIEQTIVNPNLKPKRVPYAAIVGDPKSYPKPYNTIIRVKLPSPVSPPNVPTLEQAGTLPARPKKVKTPEQIAAMRARLEKARAVRASMAAEKLADKPVQ